MSRTLLLLVLSLAAVACLPPEPTTPPAVVCGPTNCNGCCSKDGACQPGGLTSACGRGGGACTSCFASQVCRGGGCSSAGTTPDAGSPSFIPATGAALQVDAAAQVSAVGSATASSASVYVPVRLHLANGDLPSLPLSAALFTLRTAAGLDYSGSASLTAQHPDGCPAGALLAPGAEVHCTVVFEVPASTTSKELVYKLPGGDTLTTPLAVPPCDRCSTRCVDLLTDVKNCGRCGRVVQVCAGGEPVCATGLTWCTSRCADLSTESANCGACGAQIAEGRPAATACPA